jgi:hypothetical protein
LACDKKKKKRKKQTKKKQRTFGPSCLPFDMLTEDFRIPFSYSAQSGSQDHCLPGVSLSCRLVINGNTNR